MRNITIEGAIHSCHNGDYRASKQHLDEVFEYISIPSLQFQSLYNLDKQDCYLSAKCYNFYIFASALQEYEKSDDYEKLEPRSPKFPPCILESIDRRFAIESRLKKYGYRPFDEYKLKKSIEKAVKWRKTVEKAMTKIYGQQL